MGNGSHGFDCDSVGVTVMSTANRVEWNQGYGLYLVAGVDPYPNRRPTPWRRVMAMKLKYADWLRRDTDEVVAVFGEAKLVRKLDGKAELRGGTDHDRANANEWISLFWHEAVLEK